MSDSDSDLSEDVRELPEHVDPQLISDIVDAVDERDLPWLRRMMMREHPADTADTLEQLPEHTFSAAMALLSAVMPPEVLIELRDEYREWAVDIFDDVALRRIVSELDSDDATLILADMEDDRRERLLAGLPARERATLSQGFAFDEETAGRLMQREFVAAPEFWTVGHTIDHARAQGDNLPEQFFEIYVVDVGFRLKGTVPLSRLLGKPRESMLADIMEPAVAEVRADMDQEEVAYLFQKYSLASAPVVDEAGRVTGMITVDDMVDVIQEENTEDLLALSNVSQAGGTDSVWDAVRARAPWLGINLFTAFIASAVVSFFEGTIEAIVALAVLMPVVAALGGNAGSQALAVAVRAIAERELSGKAAGRAVRRELMTGVVNGLIFALGVSVIAYVWFRDVKLSAVLAAAMLLTFIWACLTGILVPLTLKRIGADPAVASSVFVLTAVDVGGFLTFLGFATLILL